MAFRTWVKLLSATLGVGALAGASQLGLAYGLGIVRLTRVLDVTTRDQWTAQLAWVAWYAMAAAVIGALAGAWLLPRWAPGFLPAPTSPGATPSLPAGSLGSSDPAVARRLDPPVPGNGTIIALAVVAAVGASVVVPLTMQPARTAQIAGVNPVLVIGICAGLGVVVGIFAAWAAIAHAIARWSLATIGIAVWVIALISVSPSLAPSDPLPAVRLGVFDAGFLSPATTQRTALFTMPALALLAGAALGWRARRQERPTLTIALAGLPGPALLTLAYLIAGPGAGDDRYQVVPYWAAMTATGAGVLGSVLAAVLRRGPGPEDGDDEPTEDRPPLPRRTNQSESAIAQAGAPADAAGDSSQPAGLRPSDTGVFDAPSGQVRPAPGSRSPVAAPWSPAAGTASGPLGGPPAGPLGSPPAGPLGSPAGDPPASFGSTAAGFPASGAASGSFGSPPAEGTHSPLGAAAPQSGQDRRSSAVAAFKARTGEWPQRHPNPAATHGPGSPSASPTRPAGTNPAAASPTSANPTSTRPTTGAKSAATRPTGVNPAGARPTGANPSATRPASANPASARPSGADPAAARTGGPAPATGVTLGDYASPEPPAFDGFARGKQAGAATNAQHSAPERAADRIAAPSARKNSRPAKSTAKNAPTPPPEAAKPYVPEPATRPLPPGVLGQPDPFSPSPRPAHAEPFAQPDRSGPGEPFSRPDRPSHPKPFGQPERSSRTEPFGQPDRAGHPEPTFGQPARSHPESFGQPARSDLESFGQPARSHPEGFGQPGNGEPFGQPGPSPLPRGGAFGRGLRSLGRSRAAGPPVDLPLPANTDRPAGAHSTEPEPEPENKARRRGRRQPLVPEPQAVSSPLPQPTPITPPPKSPQPLTPHRPPAPTAAQPDHHAEPPPSARQGDYPLIPARPSDHRPEPSAPPRHSAPLIPADPAPPAAKSSRFGFGKSEPKSELRAEPKNETKSQTTDSKAANETKPGTGAAALSPTDPGQADPDGKGGRRFGLKKRKANNDYVDWVSGLGND